jgi:superfamily II DNA or RNA helicase
MQIIIKNKLSLLDVPAAFSKILCEELTIANPQYLENRKYGRWNGKTPKQLHFYEKEENNLILPKGYIDQLMSLCKEHKILFSLVDKTRILPEVNFNFIGYLKDLQENAADDMLNFDIGTLSAPTGSGKTVISLYLIAITKQPALVIVHTTDLLNQWVQRIETFLGIPKENIGIIGVGQKKIGKKITVALVQSLYKCSEQVSKHIGYLIVDECHRIPSRTFTQAVVAFDCRYLIGLSATTYRRDNLSELIFLSLGDLRHEIDKKKLIKNGSILKPEIITRRTTFKTTKYDPVHEYSKMISELIEDPERNHLICSDIAKEAKKDNTCLVLSDRKTHCKIIQQILTNFGISSALLTGDIPNDERQIITDKLNKGQIKVLIATGQLIGEGFDCKALSVLFLATPVRFSGRIIQYAGRILRPAEGKKKAILYDYVDIEIKVLRASAQARKKALTT